MRLMLWAILIGLMAVILPLDLPSGNLRMTIFVVGYFTSMAMFIIGFGRSMSLPGFKKWNAPKKRRAPKPWFISLI